MIDGRLNTNYTTQKQTKNGPSEYIVHCIYMDTCKSRNLPKYHITNIIFYKDKEMSYNEPYLPCSFITALLHNKICGFVKMYPVLTKSIVTVMKC